MFVAGKITVNINAQSEFCRPAYQGVDINRSLPCLIRTGQHDDNGVKTGVRYSGKVIVRKLIQTISGVSHARRKERSAPDFFRQFKHGNLPQIHQVFQIISPLRSSYPGIAVHPDGIFFTGIVISTRIAADVGWGIAFFPLFRQYDFLFLFFI